jgi:hypothetical protein
MIMEFEREDNRSGLRGEKIFEPSGDIDCWEFAFGVAAESFRHAKRRPVAEF